MIGMLSEGGSLGSVHHLGAMSDHVAAVRRVMGSLAGRGAPGRLPAHLMYSDRDFDENDYEMLLALDENVASRKGAVPAFCGSLLLGFVVLSWLCH